MVTNDVVLLQTRRIPVKMNRLTGAAETDMQTQVLVGPLETGIRMEIATLIVTAKYSDILIRAEIETRGPAK